MKVAVISSQETQTGKSTLALLLGSLFARTQARTAVVLSTDKLVEDLKTVRTKKEVSIANSVSVFEAVMSTGAAMGRELLDYGVKVGENECYVFDIFDTQYDRAQLNSLFLKTLNAIEAELVLVEIDNEAGEEFNKEVLTNVDAILYLFTLSPKSIKRMQDWREKMPRYVTSRTGYICSKYDRNTIGEKNISKTIEIPVERILQYPYNANIPKEAFKGTLDTVANCVAYGHEEVINLRPKMEEIMQFLFDSRDFKYIKGASTWYR